MSKLHAFQNYAYSTYLQISSNIWNKLLFHNNCLCACESLEESCVLSTHIFFSSTLISCSQTMTQYVNHTSI